MEPETPRDRTALRDVARLAAPAGMTSPAAKREARRATTESSGVIDLEALMKSHPNWLDDALSRAKGGPASIPPGSLSALSAPVLLAPPSLAPTSLDDAPVGVPKNNIALIAATVGALVLVGAATMFAFKAQTKAPVQVATATAAPLVPASHVEDPIPPPPVGEVAAPPVANAAVAAAPASNAPASGPQDNPTQANASDPAPAAEDTAPSRHGHGHGVHHAALSHSAAASMAEAPAPAPAPAAKPAKATSALDAALRGAAGPVAAAPPAAAAAPAAAPPAAGGGDRPDRPSGSAVTSALTSALPGARGCLASGAAPSHARVTFGSNGGVQSVELTGPAAGDRKATSCLRAAFGHAHVPPFAQSSYSAGVTVRPQ